MPLLYLVAKRLIGVRAALIATAIGAVAPFWVWHSDEARMYPMVLCAGLASMALLFAAVDKGGFWRWRAYAVYLLARQGIKPANALSNVEQELSRRYAQAWPTDLSAGWLAASWVVSTITSTVRMSGFSLLHSVRRRSA